MCPMTSRGRKVWPPSLLGEPTLATHSVGLFGGVVKRAPWRQRVSQQASLAAGWTDLVRVKVLRAEENGGAGRIEEFLRAV
jgi:hypothetical protein